MSKFKHLFFDLDNTLLDFSYASHQAFSATLKYFQKSAPSSYHVYNIGNAKVWQEFEIGLISAEILRVKRFDLFLSAMSWEGDALEWNMKYLEFVIANTKYVTGAEELIKKLSKDFNIHIVTNGLKEAQRPRLERTSLLPYLDSITVSDEIGFAKPNGKFFEVAMRNADLDDKSEILMVGDSYNSDIKGGNNFGLKTCWLNPTKKKVDSKIHDFEIHDISALVKILS